MCYRWKADIFLIRAAGLLKSKCRQHFPITPQLASSKIKFKVAFISNPWLWDPWLPLSDADENSCPRPCRGLRMQTSVLWVRPCILECIWLRSSGTHPGELWAVEFYFSKFRFGNQKGGWKLLHLMLLWLHWLLFSLFRCQSQTPVSKWIPRGGT